MAKNWNRVDEPTPLALVETRAREVTMGSFPRDRQQALHCTARRTSNSSLVLMLLIIQGPGGVGLIIIGFWRPSSEASVHSYRRTARWCGGQNV